MDKKDSKRGRGRPPKPANEKQEQVTFRLSANERALVDLAAIRCGIARAEYMRRLVISGAQKDAKNSIDLDALSNCTHDYRASE